MLNYKSQSKSVICPNCYKKIYSPSENSNINETNSDTINELNIDHEEFDSITCEICSWKFNYVICIYCKENIYFKKNKINLDLNGLNGYNIQCPYLFCNNSFYLTKCPKCQKIQKQKCYIKEGDKIKCQNRNCNFEYTQIHCPIKDCFDIENILNNRQEISNDIILNHNHNNENIIYYQKINCVFCLRPIVYKSINKKNKYYESQKVICPYKECQKTFHKIFCPNCNNEKIITDDFYEMGSKIKCNNINCHTEFGKILCPQCENIQILTKKYFKIGAMKCGYCSKQTIMINCIYCRQLNIFTNKKKLPFLGQIIKCGYCEKKFNSILCPFCGDLNPFPLANFTFGKVYTCIYDTCHKKFQYIFCPGCYSHSCIDDQREGKKFKCVKCNMYFMNWGCPFCNSNIMDINTKLQIGQLVKCPKKNCGKIYSFIRCSGCYKLYFSKENENLTGISIKCNCGIYTVSIKCILCGMRSVLKGQKKSYKNGDIINCPNCKKKFKFEQKKDIYSGNMEILPEIEGGKINFGEGEIDQNLLHIKSLLLDCNVYKNPLQFINSIFQKDKIIGEISYENGIHDSKYAKKECIICHNNPRQSVFVPCGHRCTCYNCAVLFFQVNKKCPLCKKKATIVIRKIYD